MDIHKTKDSVEIRQSNFGFDRKHEMEILKRKMAEEGTEKAGTRRANGWSD